HVVDLFEAALSHVRDVEVAGAGVEAGAPGIAQAVGVDLVAVAARTVVEGVVLRNDVALSAQTAVRRARGGCYPARIDTQHLAQQRGQALSVPAGAVHVATAPAV